MIQDESGGVPPADGLRAAVHADGGKLLGPIELRALDILHEALLRPHGPPSGHMLRRIDAARRAHSLGLSLVPLAGKRPRERCWSTRARETGADVEAWARAGNVGLRTGSVSGVVVVDVDHVDLGSTLAAAGLSDLLSRPTWRVRTGSGKWHLYLRLPAGAPVISNSVGRLGDRIDVRGDGGQVVFPGSTHPDTAESYEWVEGCGPDNGPPAEVPTWLLDRLAKLQREDRLPAAVAGPGTTTAYGRGALDRECRELATAKQGTRNDRLNTAAYGLGRLVGGGELTEGDAYEGLVAAAQKCGLSAHEAGATIRSGLTAGKKEPRSAPLEFHLDEKSCPYPTPHNIRVSLAKQGVRVSYDEFTDRKLIDGLAGFGPHLDDRAIVHLWLVAQERYRLRVPKELFHDVVSDFALENRRHPVREYLAGLTWDEVPRVATWLIDYAGAEDGPYVRAVATLMLVAAVRRIRQPGCKFDECLILEGPQGGGKSSLLRALCPDESWFSDDLPLDGETKRLIEAVKGKWILEAGELKGMRRAEVDALKAMLSRQVDRARMAYGREPVELPRQCVIFGTTNSQHYLKDQTGHRRFWPVRCGALRPIALAEVRDQLWAEATHLEAAGASIRLDPALYPAAAQAQAEREQLDPFEEALAPLLAGRTGRVRTADLWNVLGCPNPASRSQDANNRLGETMRRLGWTRTRQRFGGVLEYCYVRGTPEEQIRTVQIADLT